MRIANQVSTILKHGPNELKHTQHNQNTCDSAYKTIKSHEQIEKQANQGIRIRLKS